VLGFTPRGKGSANTREAVAFEFIPEQVLQSRFSGAWPRYRSA
jgi:hypothetical protein